MPDLDYLRADLGEPSAPGEVVAAAVERFGRVDTLVAAHAHSTATPLGSLDAGEIDRHLTVNVRGTLLLVEEFAGAHDPEQDQGRIVLFSSGQRLGPMPGELAYVASKGGTEALVLSLAELLARAGMTSTRSTLARRTPGGYRGRTTRRFVRGSRRGAGERPTTPPAQSHG